MHDHTYYTVERRGVEEVPGILVELPHTENWGPPPLREAQPLTSRVEGAGGYAWGESEAFELLRKNVLQGAYAYLRDGGWMYFILLLPVLCFVIFAARNEAWGESLVQRARVWASS